MGTMMTRLFKQRSKPLATSILGLVGTSGSASAHVKWFCAFDVAGQPVGLENVLCPDFELLVGLAMAVLLTAGLAEGTGLGVALLRATDRVLAPLRAHSDIIIRAVCGFFFVALWTIGQFILTPELRTTAPLIPLLQLAIAAGLIWRQTMVASALGIVVLFAVAVHDYGAFHLMDYPIFLGIAGYLALSGLQRRPFGIKPLDVARWATSITLMWASIEKWAYPEWSFPLFVTHPQVSMGFDPAFFMRAAGVVEFGLSFALIWTPLCRRVAAIVLAGMFLAAIVEFGKVDAIGHAPIIAVVLAIAAQDVAPVLTPRRRAVLAPFAFAAALAGFLVLYYGLHAALFGTSFT
jgi:hypothetical protein